MTSATEKSATRFHDEHDGETQARSSKMATAKVVLAVANDLVAAGVRQAQMAKLQLEAYRLDAKINSEKDAIGHALFPLLESNLLQVDVPEVGIRMKAVSELFLQLAAKKAEIDAVNRPDPSQSAATNGAGHYGTSPHPAANNALE